MVRGSVSLPHGTGKTARVVVFCRQEAQIKAALEAGAEMAGSDELVEARRRTAGPISTPPSPRPT
jgi:large subunit ribosomal protein L1